jgi:hypothetical protein
MKQESESIDDIAQDATVKYTKGKRTYEKILSAMSTPKDSHPLGKEGEMLMLVVDAYKQGWQDGFTARLSGVKGD